MQISSAFENRAYPETQPWCSLEIAFDFMAAQFRRASGDNKCLPIKPDPNSNTSRKLFRLTVLANNRRSLLLQNTSLTYYHKLPLGLKYF